MSCGNLLILGGADVAALLGDLGAEVVVDLMRRVYLAHEEGRSVLPHSVFVRMPDSTTDRFIALPAYLHADRPMAGIKWIASFPGNHARGLERASAAILLNSTETGQPEALLEGSLISAARTAASAVLALQVLHGRGRVRAMSLIGCGRIHAEVVRYATCICPELERLTLFDLAFDRAQRFREAMRRERPHLTVEIVRSLDAAIDAAAVVSFATTAVEPYCDVPVDTLMDKTVLHISLRDLSPRLILEADNVVDDADHVCREKTSLQLAALGVGHRRFIWQTLASVLSGAAPPRDSRRPVVFNPFGLGILDIALAQMIVMRARDQRRGVDLRFQPGEPDTGAAPVVYAPAAGHDNYTC